MSKDRVIFTRGWAAHVEGADPFADVPNPDVLLIVRRVGKHLRANLVLCDVSNQTPQRILPLEVTTLYQYKGVLKRSGVGYYISLEPGIVALTLRKGRRGWTLKVEHRLDISVENEPELIVQLGGKWGEHFFVQDPNDS